MFVKTVTMPSGTKSMYKQTQNRSYIATITPDSIKQDKMAYYKQFCRTATKENKEAQPQLHLSNLSNHVQDSKYTEDKMAFYKQFSEKK